MEAAQAIGGRPHALRLLSLDGGGIRGISELIILEEIMHRVQRTLHLSSVPLPVDYFDMICGTSTGGLIALLLGRLRLSVPEAIDKYRQLAKQVFSERKSFYKDGIFKASNLERAIKDVVEWKFGKGRADERMFTSQVKDCKTFVCAVPATHVNREPRLFRTWSADKNPGYDCTIWEAGRATSAAPTFFKRISIGKPGMQEEFIDAGIGCNNPVQYLVEEAHREFGPRRAVGCIVSIGTGKPKLAGFKAPSRFQRVLPLDLIKVLSAVTTDSEAVSSAMETRYQHCDGLYHRLNVEKGLEEISLEEWNKLGEVTTHTMEYLKGENVSQELDAIVSSLIGKPARTFLLRNLDGSVPAEPSNKGLFIYPPYKVGHFIERKGPLDMMTKELQVLGSTSRPMIFVLVGVGGCGKSQLALEYCYQAEDSRTCSAIFWIDATSPITAQKSFGAVAQAMLKPNFSISDDEGNLQFVRNALGDWHGRWLLVFDNFDDPASFRDKSLKEYFPQRGHGSILITGRHEEAKSLGHHIDVTIMSDEEALELLLRRSLVDRSDTNMEEGRKIIKRLGFHALAIDQAGAYIQARNLEIGLYLKHFNSRRERVLSETPELWDYKRALKENPETSTKLTVFTTWELSFELITGNNNSREDKEHILTLIAFLDGRELSDELFEPYALENSNWMTSCNKDGEWDALELQDILTELRNLSLLQSLKINEDGAWLSLHPLIQDWIKLRASPESRRLYSKEAILVIGESLACQDLNRMILHAKQSILAHVEAALTNKQEYLSEDSCLEDDNFLRAMSWFADLLEFVGRYETAEELYRYVLEGQTSLLGDEHPISLVIMNNLAVLLKSQGKYDKAEPMHRQALALNEKVLGKEHPDTLSSINNLARLLQSQGKYDEAEPMYRQALALSEKVLGKEHPNTLGTLYNLACLLEDQNNLEEAEVLFRRELAGFEIRFGDSHSWTIQSLEDFAIFLDKTGKNEEAGAVRQRLSDIREGIVAGKFGMDSGEEDL